MIAAPLGCGKGTPCPLPFGGCMPPLGYFRPESEGLGRAHHTIAASVFPAVNGVLPSQRVAVVLSSCGHAGSGPTGQGAAHVRRRLLDTCPSCSLPCTRSSAHLVCSLACPLACACRAGAGHRAWGLEGAGRRGPGSPVLVRWPAHYSTAERREEGAQVRGTESARGLAAGLS